MKEQQEFQRPPKVFLVPFILITCPAFVIGTIFSFARIGFKVGVGGVEHIYFAKQRAEWQKQQEAMRRQAAEEMARQIEEHLRASGLGEEGRVEVISPSEEEKK